MRLPMPELRARMKACAAEWAVKKREGAAAGLVWSEFSRRCLDESDGADAR